MVGRMWHRAQDWLERRPAVLPLLLLSALLIALAAGPTPSEGSWTGLPSTDLIRWLLAGVVIALSGVGLLMLVAARGVSNKGETKRRSWVATLVTTMFLIGLFSLIDFEAELLEPEEPPIPPVVNPGPAGQEMDPGPGFEAGDATALLLILAVAVLLLIWTRRSIVTPEADEIEEASPLGEALGRAEEQLLAGKDAREAVLLAYRDLERTLTTLALPRRDAETPNEHLDRALAALSIVEPSQAQPLRDLAGLYARARYSDHRITKDEQHRAGAALGRARRQLAGAG